MKFRYIRFQSWDKRWIASGMDSPVLRRTAFASLTSSAISFVDFGVNSGILIVTLMPAFLTISPDVDQFIMRGGFAA